LRTLDHRWFLEMQIETTTCQVAYTLAHSKLPALSWSWRPVFSSSTTTSGKQPYISSPYKPERYRFSSPEPALVLRYDQRCFCDTVTCARTDELCLCFSSAAWQHFWQGIRHRTGFSRTDFSLCCLEHSCNQNVRRGCIQLPVAQGL